MLTPFGKALRSLRLDKGMLLKDMAEDLGVTSSYLSSVETGKRNIPEEWPQRIGKLYDLNPNELKKLLAAATASATQIKLDLSEVDDKSRELAVAFARKFSDLSPEDQNEILTLLKNRRPNT